MEPLATFGPYTLLRAIAANRESVSFAARFEGAKDGEYVAAVKVLLPTLFQNAGFSDALVDHLRLATRLNHVNVAQVFDYGRTDDLAYIALEFVDGVPIALIQEAVSPGQKAVTAEVAAFICAEACAGLAYAHGRRDERGNVLGIVHSRVSPRTVLLSKSGLVKMVDFGLARAITELSALTPDDYELQFLAPEVVRGDEFDGRADVFSVGAVAFLLLTGRFIYDDALGEELGAKARRGYVPAVADVDPTVPAPLAELVDKALAAEPDARFADATEFRSGLAAWLRRNSPGFGRHRLKSYLGRLLPETIYGLLPGHEWEALHRKNFVFCDPDSLIGEAIVAVDGIATTKDPIGHLLENPDLPHLERLDVAAMQTGAHRTVREAAAGRARADAEGRARPTRTPPPMASVAPVPMPADARPVGSPPSGERLDESGEVDKAFDSISMTAIAGPPELDELEAIDEISASGEIPAAAPERPRPAPASGAARPVTVSGAAPKVEIDPDLVYDDRIDFETQRSVVAEAIVESRTFTRRAALIGTFVAIALIAGLGYGAWLYVQQQHAREAQAAAERQATPVFVTSRPQGARILVGGHDTGLRTPAPLRDLEGAVEVSVALQGFDAPPARTLDPAAPPSELAFDLVPAEHRVRIDSEPAGASVVYEGEVVGTTPTVLGPLRVDYRQGIDVVLRMPGYLDEAIAVDWAPEQGESSVRRPLRVDPNYVAPAE